MAQGCRGACASPLIHYKRTESPAAAGQRSLIGSLTLPLPAEWIAFSLAGVC